MKTVRINLSQDYKAWIQRTMEKYGYKTNLLTPEHKEYTKKYLEENYNKSNFYEIRRKSGKKKFVLQSNIYDLVVENIEMIETKYEEIFSSSNYNYLFYKNECRRFTRRNIKKLFEKWDGKDYYDGEDIKDYFQLEHNNRLYPTIDHKISVYHGFKNDIDPKVIGSLENLCITKRTINSAKRQLIEEDFKI
jgi:hypothetical protein